MSPTGKPWRACVRAVWLPSEIRVKINGGSFPFSLFHSVAFCFPAQLRSLIRLAMVVYVWSTSYASTAATAVVGVPPSVAFAPVTQPLSHLTSGRTSRTTTAVTGYSHSLAATPTDWPTVKANAGGAWRLIEDLARALGNIHRFQMKWQFPPLLV